MCTVEIDKVGSGQESVSQRLILTKVSLRIKLRTFVCRTRTDPQANRTQKKFQIICEKSDEFDHQQEEIRQACASGMMCDQSADPFDPQIMVFHDGAHFRSHWVTNS